MSKQGHAAPRARDTSRPLWIVAHDFSPCADAAADRAVDDLVTAGGGKLVLLHVFRIDAPGALQREPVLAIEYRSQEEATKRAALARLTSIAQRLHERAAKVRSSAIVDVKVDARVGEPIDVALAEVVRRRADRILVGTHGRTGLSRMLLGSVAEGVVRRALVPVVVVHAIDRADEVAVSADRAPGGNVDGDPFCADDGQRP